jgi:hypothetical protein
MVDRDALIQQLTHSRQKINAVLARVEPQREIYPEWTLKELLAHLTGWDDACLESISAHLRGQEAGTPAERGINYYNAQSVLERKELAFDRIQREYELARQDLIQLIREMPEAKLNEPFILPWAEKGTVMDLVHIFAHHELEHAQEIEALLNP